MQLVWQNFLNIVKEEAGIQVVETWFKAVSLEKWDKQTQTVHLKIPNQFVGKWLKEHYLNLIKNKLGKLFKSDKIEISFICTQQNISKDIIPASIIHSHEKEKVNKLPLIKKSGNLKLIKKPTPSDILSQNNINHQYRFDSFIIGPSNSLAHAASYAICQNLGKIYNPLFIYGGTGLGKTHLLHSIANESKRKNLSIKILYQSTDKFTSEFINSIRLDRTRQFREKYQKVDLLLLDDAQFFSKKEQTQEMFFHIFNLLYEQKKQIVLSSDTFPKEIKGLQARLKSRMEWGLVVDIQTPDLETKIAILKKKAELNFINLNDDVANFIASRVHSNIRELEGALIRVGAFGTLTNRPISLELAKKVLLHLNKKKKDGIMLDSVLKIVARSYAVSINDLKSKKRHKNIALVRQVTFYLMKKLTFCSLQAIGEFVGKRDHSTVLHAISKVESLIDSNKEFAKKLDFIEQKILMN